MGNSNAPREAVHGVHNPLGCVVLTREAVRGVYCLTGGAPKRRNIKYKHQAQTSSTNKCKEVTLFHEFDLNKRGDPSKIS